MAWHTDEGDWLKKTQLRHLLPVVQGGWHSVVENLGNNAICDEANEDAREEVGGSAVGLPTGVERPRYLSIRAGRGCGTACPRRPLGLRVLRLLGCFKLVCRVVWRRRRRGGGDLMPQFRKKGRKEADEGAEAFAAGAQERFSSGVVPRFQQTDQVGLAFDPIAAVGIFGVFVNRAKARTGARALPEDAGVVQPRLILEVVDQGSSPISLAHWAWAR